jgi:hypothetical protein
VTVAEEFSNADIRGPYGFAFDGFVTLTLPNGSPISVPVSAVGQLTLDGAGEATGTRTLNLGGFMVLEQESCCDRLWVKFNNRLGLLC